MKKVTFSTINYLIQSEILSLITTKFTMKNLLFSLAILSSTCIAIRPAQAQFISGQNNVGPSVLFGNGQTSIGIDSRFGISDNISVRPSIYFPNNTTTFGAAITYDVPGIIDSERRLTPYAGVGVRFNSGGSNNNTNAYITAGADYNIDPSYVLKANVNLPISSNDSTTVAIGAGLRF